MKIILTGISGFLGSNVAKFLLSKDIKVVGIIRSSSDLSKIKGLIGNPLLKIIEFSQVEDILKEEKIEAIIHTATLYGRNNEAFSDMIGTNLIFPLKLVELGAKYSVKVFINTDTFLEKIDRNQKDRKYIVTKKSFIVSAKEVLTPEVIFVNMKIHQMYGPSDNPTKFIPTTIKQFLSNKERVALNPGLVERDYIYIDDAAEAYYNVLTKIDKLNSFEEFEIGTGKTNTLKDIISEIASATSSKSIAGFGDIPYHPREIMTAKANIENNKKIDWQAYTNLKGGIMKTIEYYDRA